MKPAFTLAIMVIVLVAQSQLVTQSVAQATTQTCSSSLASLNVCAPFVVPGATNPAPSADCCTALQGIDHNCICNTLRISSRLPSRCNLPPLTCGGN